jgi:hypothetical protein
MFCKTQFVMKAQRTGMFRPEFSPPLRWLFQFDEHERRMPKTEKIQSQFAPKNRLQITQWRKKQ